MLILIFSELVLYSYSILLEDIIFMQFTQIRKEE